MHDDTDALRKMLHYSNDRKVLAYIPSGFIFYFTGPLNFFESKYHNYCLNILGSIPSRKTTHAEEYGYLLMKEGCSMFKDAELTGSIRNIAVSTTKRNVNSRLFDTCTCRSMTISGCSIMNFGAAFYDTSIRQVTQITGNSFWSVYFFSKVNKRSSGCIDSTISLNYINGGQEIRDNVCFEWGYYNGSLITNNFVDYYRTIYQPSAIKEQEFVGPLSTGNEYQVFRYLYYPGRNITMITFYSYSDAFNWNNPSKLEVLARYIPISYKDRKGKEHDIPPFVAMCNNKWKITVKGAKIEENMKNLVFVNSSLSQYSFNYFDVEFVGNNPRSMGQISWRNGDSEYYNGGEYMENKMSIKGIIEEFSDSLPRFGLNWTNTIPGRKVIINNKVYIAENVLIDKRWQSIWREENK